MSESIHARLARLHAELAEVYRELERTPTPQQAASQPLTASHTAIALAAGPPRALRAKDVAARLGVSERKVREMRAKSELPPTLPVSNVCRWDAAVIEQWVKERARG